MRPGPGEVLHFSEDPRITEFRPHVAPTSAEAEAYVWAVDAFHAPSYWFPRQCPRGMAWVAEKTTDADRDRIIGAGAGAGARVHAVEYRWLPRLMAARLYAYRLPAQAFRPVRQGQTHALVSTERVVPLAPPEPVIDLVRLHEEAGIQLRLLDNLWPFWDQVVQSSCGFSGIRMRNAQPRP